MDGSSNARTRRDERTYRVATVNRGRRVQKRKNESESRGTALV
jgi:hypothetical protein